MHGSSRNIQSALDVTEVLLYLVFSAFFARQFFRERLAVLIPKQILLSALFFILAVAVVTISVLLKRTLGNIGPDWSRSLLDEQSALRPRGPPGQAEFDLG